MANDVLVFYDGDGEPITGHPSHGTHAWTDKEGKSPEYVYSNKEGWVLRKSFEQRYRSGYANQ